MNDSMIPAEAVEAAAKGIWEARPMERVSEEGSPNYGAAKPWADIKQYQRDRCMTLARFALEAAAPYIRAQALDDAADEFEELPANKGPYVLSGTWEWFELFPITHIRGRAAAERGAP